MVKRILIVDNNLTNSDWTKANVFDFPSVKNLADFEEAMMIPSEPVARRTKLASYAGLAWFPVAPDDIRHAIIEAARQQDLVKMLMSKGLSALKKFNPHHDELGRFATGDSTSKQLDLLSAQQVPLATSEDRAILRKYSEFGSREVNHDLRGQKTLAQLQVGDGPNFPRKDAVVFVEAFDRVATETTDEMTVFRGLKAKAERVFTVGETFTDKGFQSTSASEEIAKGFAQHTIYDLSTIIKIRVPKGTKVLAMDNFANRGKPTDEDFYYEKEVVLQRNTTFRVVKVINNDYKFVNADGENVVLKGVIVEVEVVG